MAYNFLFFYPLTFLSIILSIIIVFRLKYFRNEILPKVLLYISIIPSTFLTIMVLINIVIIANEPEILDLEIPNNTVNIKVNDSLEIKLHGFTKRIKGENDENIDQRIVNLVPYVHGTYRFKDGGKFTGDSINQELFYNMVNDSLVVYNFQYDYHFFNRKRIVLPFKIESISTQKLSDEKIKSQGFKKFEWK